ncbi:MAG TPA: CoA-binding protein [Bryobacteraceae bacterium]|nr:CoA-binding protein [Bryobacteraceae bacterium]
MINLELEILKSAKTVAVVGLSSHQWRPSYEIAEYLQKQGYRIIPVNPNEKQVLGEAAYARLEDVPEKVDLVSVFRRPEFVPDVVESAIAIGAKAVWMQPGAVHPRAVERAREAGLLVVDGPCIFVEHRRLKSELG